MELLRLSQIARWLLAAFASVLLLSILGLVLRKGDGFVPGVAYSAFLTCWLSLPVALTALLVTSAKYVWTLRAYFAAEVIVVASSAWLLPPVFLISDAQNGIALAFLPIIQGGAVLLYTGLVWLVQALLLQRRA